ncbi:MAG: efflux RND transporter periplasmic adaptor subunit [Bacteroidetes bacterium]|jgi:membrane fusion protein (multidrug efflux system)|nr:MAG: efflux RND transporter periplasmic adaptor subunit [Bacteroidota bacterium]
MTNKNNIMKEVLKIVSAVLFIFILAACGSGAKDKKGDVGDKKVQLEKLRTDKAKLDADIKKLEDEIAKLDPTSQEKTKLVAIAPVTEQDFTHYIDLQGKVDADNVVNVMPRSQPAQVRQVYVKSGDHVRKGQLLLKLDDALIQQQIDASNTQIAFARNIYNRRKNLWDQGIGTEVEVINAKNQLDAAERQLALLKEGLQMTSIIAPIDGVADIVDVRAGETFTGVNSAANPPSPQLRIINSSSLKVVTEVPENYAGRVKKGSPVVITIPDAGNDSIRSTISTIGSSITPTSRGFTTESKLPSKPGYRINQVALVRIKDYSAPKAITVDIKVVQSDESGKYVYIAVKEGNALKARKRKVVLGQTYNTQAEIKSGLTTADQIITEGYQSVYDGQVITTEIK